MRRLNKKDVKFIWKKTTRHYNVRVINVRSWLQRLLYSGILKLAKTNLLQMGIEAVDDFLKTRWITTAVGKRIYIIIPGPIGGKHTPLKKQCEICAHEHEHVLQYRELGTLQFDTDYTFNASSRAIFEGNAKAAGADVTYTLEGSVPTADEIFTLKWGSFYLLSNQKIIDARATYNKRVEKLRSGLAYATQPGAFVSKLLKKRLKD